MIHIHRIALLCCFNMIWQIPLLYMAAFLSDQLLSCSNAIVRYRLWVATFFLCLGLPLLGATGWLQAFLEHALFHTRPISKSASESILAGADRMHSVTSTGYSLFDSVNAPNLLLCLWGAWILYRAFQIGWTYRRIAHIISKAKPSVRRVRLGDFLPTMNGRAIDVLVCEKIGMPATAGVWRPVVLLPRVIEHSALRRDLDAVLAHESAHITRHDFVCNLIFEVLSIPMAYNPAMRCLLGRISETRELICDRMAAEHVGGATQYAESLVRVSEMLLKPITSTDFAIGLFNGQELEKRVMSLLNLKTRSTRQTAIVGLLSLSIFAPCCFATASISYQPAALVAADLQPYAGTWHWMFKGHPFITMQLVTTGDHFTGYMTNGFFRNDKEGNMIDAGSHPGRSVIVRTFFSGKILHIVVQDNQDQSLEEWTMKLIDSKTAEFNTVAPDAPKNLKPWIAEHTPN